MPVKKNFAKTIIIWLVVLAIIIAISTFLFNFNSAEKVIYSQVLQDFRSGNVESFKIDKDSVLVYSMNGKLYENELRDVDYFREDLKDVLNSGSIKEYNYESVQVSWWVTLIPYAIVIIAFVFIWWLFISRSSAPGGGGGFGGRINSFSKARTKLGSDEKVKVTFDDVAGADEEKEELQEVVDFLKNPEKYASLGARIPKGVLLIGPPGTGKTLLAKAVAGEGGVPFYSISGSDFVEMYVGVGASRVRDLFETAKKTSPCIIFIDEIDAVGRHRGSGLGGSHDEREQTLNQLLVEMDGFGVNDGVIVIAATNRPDILDHALLRPGRFDRQVTVNRPDIKGRIGILKVHAKNKPIGKDVDFEVIAKSTSGMTGADLSNILNEAALLAARKKKNIINMEEIEEAILKEMVGPKKKSLVLSDKEKLNTAYHEAGHAVVEHELPTSDPVHQISIIPSGGALGYTLNIPTEDKMNIFKDEMFERICGLLGGRACEDIIMNGNYSAGASSDIERASKLARDMVMKYGMSDRLGPIQYGNEGDEVFLGRDFGTTKAYSESIASAIDEEVSRIIQEAYAKAKEILLAHRSTIEFIAQFLMKYETMDGEQFELCFTENPTDELLLAAKEKKAAQKKSLKPNAEQTIENNANPDKPADQTVHADEEDTNTDVDFS